MTESRNRPAQGPRSQDGKVNTESPSDEGHLSGSSSILDQVLGFSHATPGSPSPNRLTDQMKLHSVIKKLMSTKSESARAAAKACGVPLSTFNSYLQPKKQVDPEHVMAIANYYGVTIDYLITGKKPPEEAFKNLPTKKIFSKWVKVTLEDLEEIEASVSSKVDGASE